jgi:hypothetical protein
MSLLTEKPRTADFILSVANGTLSIENVILASGQNLNAGTVLGKVTASAKFVQLAPAAADGSQNAAGILTAATDASAADAACVIVAREAEVKADALIWPTGVTTPQTLTALGQLAGANVIVR